MTITARSVFSRAAQSITVGMLCLVCVAFAEAQQVEARLLKKQKLPAVEPAPLEFSGLRAGSAAINFDQPFQAGEDWVKGLSFDLKNVSGKTITHFRIGLYLHNPDNQQRAVATMVFHGRNTGMPGVEPSVRVAPGETVHAGYEDKQYESFKRVRQQIALGKVTEATLSIEMVVFDDDTAWRNGYLMRRDSADPLRWNVVRAAAVAEPARKPNA